VKRKSYLLGTIIFRVYQNGDIWRVDKEGYENFYCNSSIRDRRKLVKHIREYWHEHKRRVVSGEEKRRRRN
jgi:hypothetical protein